VGTNSYISLADAKTYASSRLYVDAWTAASDDNKSIALIMATSKIDRQRIRGEKAVYNQTLAFPRAFYLGSRYNRKNGLTIDNVRGEGWYVEVAVTQIVKDAVCEEAFAILKAGASGNKRKELQAQGVTSFSLGSLSETYASGSSIGEKLLSLEARQLLSKYFAGVVPIC
jgi:hypothetical protein